MAISTASRSPVSRLWERELEHYPRTGTRYLSLGIVVVATIVLYYQFYLAGSLAAGTGGKNGIIPDLHMSFVYYVNISVVGYLFGAAASFAAGISDRYGRANIVTAGLLLTGLLCLIGIPMSHSKLAFAIVFILIGLVEGVILVATPALIRDFSPQLGRASAMGFWTLGPVLGSLVVSIIISNSSLKTPWRDQYAVCGVVGLVVFAIAAIGLRELAPNLRDQLMVSSRDRALIEARAKGIDVEAGLRHPIRQMLRLDIVGSAFAISVFLIIYYLAVGFFPVFFQTVFGYSQSKANSLGNWFWAFDALALLIIGFLSDLIRVRKPFMLVGAIGAIVFTSIFATKATHPHTSYSTFVLLLSLVAVVPRSRLRALDGELHRDRRATQPGADRHWFGGMGSGDPAGHRGLGLLRAARGQHRHHPGGQGCRGAGTRRRQRPEPDPRSERYGQGGSGRCQHRAEGEGTIGRQYASQLATAAKLEAGHRDGLDCQPNRSGNPGASDQRAVRQAGCRRRQGAQPRHSVPRQLLAAAPSTRPPRRRWLPSQPIPANQAKAVGEIAQGLKVSPAAAVPKLQALARVPAADLSFLKANAAPMQAAGTQLIALGAVPAADLAYLKQYGTGLQDPKVVSALTFLQQQAPGVQKAAKDSPKQWQKYFWIAVGGEVLFIPLIFVMAGFWDPRKAKAKQVEHQAWVDAELARLAAASRRRSSSGSRRLSPAEPAVVEQVTAAQQHPIARVGRIGAERELAVELVNEHDGRPPARKLILAQLGVGDDDHQISGSSQPCGGAVDTDHPAASRSGDRVGREPGTVVDVDHVHLLTGQQVSGGQQVGVDGDRADVVQVGLGHRRAMDLGLQHLSQHDRAAQQALLRVHAQGRTAHGELPQGVCLAITADDR